MIKQESIKKLKEIIDIIELIQQYLPNIKRSGKNYFALCPFHSERTPSFSVAIDKGLIYCFGCNYSGDIFKFISDMEHISYYEAVEKVAKKVNFQLEYVSPEQQKEFQQKYEEIRFLTDLLTAVAEVYHRILLTEEIASAARNYLVSRGVKIQTIQKYKIGFAPQDNFICKNYKILPELKDYNCDLSSLYKAGIVNFKTDEKGNKNYDQPYDWFRNRIVFPIYNITGKVVGFGGRVVPGSIDSDFSGANQPPVYLNTTETVVFNKGNNLYGLYQAKEFVTQQKSICIVEGYMDVILLSQEGINTVVAPLGTALTEQQVRLMKRFPVEKIYLLFDPDDAGVEATLSAAKTIFSVGEYPLVVQLDDNIDPDEYVLKYGVDKLKDLFTKSVSVVKYIVQRSTQEKMLTVTEKLPLLKKLMELVINISHPLTKSEVVKEIAQELKIDESIIRSEQKKFVKKHTELTLEKMLTYKPYSCEEELLWICIHHPEVVQEITEDVFSHDDKCLQIFKKIKQCHLENKDIVELISSLEPPLKDIVVRLVFEEKKISTSLEEKIKLLYNEIYISKIKKHYNTLKPVVEDMLQGKIGYNPEIINEFKQTLEILKLGSRR